MKKVLLACLLSALFVTACRPMLPGAAPRLPSALTPVAPGGLEDYADVRDKDLSDYEGVLDRAKVKTLWFNSTTHWPEGVDSVAGDLIERGKNPGLGIRQLHAQGITGKGVNVAIIDQNLVWPADHPEFKGKIAQYRDFDTGQRADSSSMHGPAVLSLLVGDTTGTAPAARVYYAAAPSWKEDAQYYADALNWIVAENEKLAQAEKIRVVSVSAAPSGEGSPFTKNGAAWDAAYQRASQAGILVLDCTEHHRILGACYYDLEFPESAADCTPGYPGMSAVPKADFILVPTSLRTTAEEYAKGFPAYQYTGQGGLSWAVPYLSGVLALGWQIHPELTGAQMLDYLFQSAAQRDGRKIINPLAFIEKVKAAEGK